MPNDLQLSDQDEVLLESLVLAASDNVARAPASDREQFAPARRRAFVETSGDENVYLGTGSEWVDVSENTGLLSKLFSGGDGEFDSVNTEDLRNDYPRSFPEGEQAVQGQIQHPPFEVVSKTRLVSVGDEVQYTDADVYWPCLVPVGDILDNPLGEWYLYLSGDHTTDGIGLYYADDITGPYTAYDSNPVYSGQETPEIIYDEQQGELILYGHPWGGFNHVDQGTGYATSSDGINWTDQGPIIDPDLAGVNHAGYARVNRWGDHWIMYHYMTGKLGAVQSGISVSNDGRTWETDPQWLPKSTHMTGGGDRYISWNNTNVLPYNGERWWVGEVADNPTGGQGANRRVEVAKMHGPRSVGITQPLITPTESWEGTETYTPHSVGHESRIYVAYATNGGVIGLAELEGGVY